MCETTKKCKICNLELPLSEFRSNTYKDGTKICIRHTCKKCTNEDRRKKWKFKPKEEQRKLRKDSALKNSYGLSLEEYNKMLDKQEGVCLLCKKEETMKFNGLIKYLSVDHDHKTGKVRGLLCSKCNVGIGCFEDNIELLEKVIKYIKQN